jgi:hypothetical protein
MRASSPLGSVRRSSGANPGSCPRLGCKSWRGRVKAECHGGEATVRVRRDRVRSEWRSPRSRLTSTGSRRSTAGSVRMRPAMIAIASGCSTLAPWPMPRAAEVARGSPTGRSSRSAGRATAPPRPAPRRQTSSVNGSRASEEILPPWENVRRLTTKCLAQLWEGRNGQHPGVPFHHTDVS